MYQTEASAANRQHGVFGTLCVSSPALTYAGDDSNNTGSQAFDLYMFHLALSFNVEVNSYTRCNLV